MRSSQDPRQIHDLDIFIDVPSVVHRTSFSIMHINRLETRGLFPKRVRIGHGRVCWSLDHILQWMQQKIDSRGGPATVITAKERFIRSAELKELVLYSPTYIRDLEARGAFPRRFLVGEKSVCWLLSEVRAWRAQRFEDIYQQITASHTPPNNEPAL